MRKRGTNKALSRSLIRALVGREAIMTTQSRAKALKRDVERLMRLVKKSDLSARRRVVAILGNDKETAKMLFSGGSRAVRVVPFPARRGDNAPMARVEFVKKAVSKKDEKDVSQKKK